MDELEILMEKTDEAFKSAEKFFQSCSKTLLRSEANSYRQMGQCVLLKALYHQNEVMIEQQRRTYSKLDEIADSLKK